MHRTPTDPWELIRAWPLHLQRVAPDRRRALGVYTTPRPLAAHMVAEVNRALQLHAGLERGLATPGLRLLDPAVGPGTFVLALLEHQLAACVAEHGPGGAGVDAFSRWLAMASIEAYDLDSEVLALGSRVIRQSLAGGLATRFGLPPSRWRFDLPDGLRFVHRNALTASAEADVVLGNPPYERISSAEAPAGLLDDLLDAARAHTIFSHHASLYDQYVLFWRWAIRAAFEAHSGPSVVSLVTNRAWLTGPGFVGLRALLRQHGSQIWATDLGGDGRGAGGGENIFGIATPVAVVTVARGERGGEACRVGLRAAGQGAAIARVEALDGLPWQPVSGVGGDPFAASAPDTWTRLPHLGQLFPWQHPGCKVGRLWPISPDPAVLAERWSRLMAADGEARAELFRTRSTGRTVHTRVRGRVPLAEETASCPPPPIVPYGYRSFDRQWLLLDPRLLALERPPLWSVRSEAQLFLVAPMTKATSEGPCLIASAQVPDLDHFRGSFGGKDVLPVYRDAAGRVPNVTPGLLATLGERLDHEVSALDLACVCLAVLGGRPFQRRFSQELGTPGPRVPLPATPRLWREAVGLGREVLRLQTRGERGGVLSPDPAVRWERLPRTPPPRSAFGSDGSIEVGEGRLIGVRPEAWEYAVSGMPVLKKWLGYRSLEGAGKGATRPGLTRVRSEAWLTGWSEELRLLVTVIHGLLDLEARQEALLDALTLEHCFSAEELPGPSEASRRPAAIAQDRG